MGNQLSEPHKSQHEHLSELNDMTLKDMLGGGRLLKTALCIHEYGGLVVVKIYYKRPGAPNLDSYRTGLEDIRERLQGFPARHVWPFQHWVETDTAAYLIRQYLYASLKHRLASRPFLNMTEKLWVAYQVLEGLAAAHNASVCHGDLKTENVLLTSSHWVYLADWASYKPICLPADNPADFSFYFDTDNRRCYIAPERFFDADERGAGQQSGPAMGTPRGRLRYLTPEMDIFSAGCVFAEIFTDGTPLFDLSQLLAYRDGKGDPGKQLADLPETLRDLILHMTQLAPGARLGAAQYLQQWGPRLFPPSFSSLLQPFMGSLPTMSSDSRVRAFDANFDTLEKGLMVDDTRIDIGTEDVDSLYEETGAPDNTEDERQEGSESLLYGSKLLSGVSTLLADTSCLLQRLSASGAATAGFDGAANGEGAFYRDENQGNTQALSIDESYIPKLPVSPSDTAHRESANAPQHSAEEGGDSTLETNPQQPIQLASDSSEGAQQDAHQCVPGMDLVAAALCPLVRGARLQHCKVRAIALLARAAQRCDDGTRLRRIVPYLVAGIGETQSPVRIAALTALVDVLAMISTLPPTDAKLITEYILPSLSLLPKDGTRAVRACYATVLPSLATSALRLLNNRRHNDSLSGSTAAAEESGRISKEEWQAEVAALREAIERPVKELMSDHPHSSATHRAMLAGLPVLAAFFNRKYRIETLLILAISFLNKNDWQLRSSLYEALPCLAGDIGPKGFDLFLRPCLDEGLKDDAAAVVVAALAFLDNAMACGAVSHRGSLDAIASIVPLLQQSSISVRAAALHTIALAAQHLSAADVYAQLQPAVRPALQSGHVNLANELEVAANLEMPPSLSNDVPMHPPARDTLPQGATLSSRPPRQTGRGSSAARSAGTSSAGTSHTGAATSQRGAPGNLLSPTASTHPGALSIRPRSQYTRASGASANTSEASTAAVHDSDAMHARPRLPSVPLYTMRVDSTHTEGDSSKLSAALETAAAAASAAALISTRRLGHKPGDSAGLQPTGLEGESIHQTRGCEQHHVSLQGSQAATALMRQARRTGPQLAHQALRGRLSLNSEEPLSLPRPQGMIRLPDDSSDAEEDNGRLIGGQGIAIPSGAAGPEPWRPQGVLVAHLAEHKSSVNQIAISGGGAFFVTASSDASLKVWDCRGLEHDASFRSRLTYAGQHGRIIGVCHAEGEASIASASDDGSLHLWRVDYTSCGSGSSGRSGPDKYTGVTPLSTVEADEGAVTSVRPWGRHLLLYTTQQGGLHGWDTRMKSDAWRLETSPRDGVVTHVAADSSASVTNAASVGNLSWLLTATLRGKCNVWDMRFRIPVSGWQHPAGGIEAVEAAAAPPSHLGLASDNPLMSRTTGGGTSQPAMVYIAAGHNEIGLWDISAGRCVQVVRCMSERQAARKPSTGTQSASRVAALQPLPHTAAPDPRDRTSLLSHLRVADLELPPPRSSGFRSLLSTGEGALLAGDSHGGIRLWSPSQPCNSYLVAAMPPPLSQAALSDETVEVEAAVTYTYNSYSRAGISMVEETACPVSPRASRASDGGAPDWSGSKATRLRQMANIAHQDAVIGLAAVEASDRLLVSACQDGVIKVWK